MICFLLPSVGILIVLNTRDCICPGMSVVSFQCSTVGPGNTLWQGTALQSCGIILPHRQFGELGEPYEECKDGEIVAYGVNSSDNTYISQLDVLVNDELRNKTVECIYNNGNNERSIGSMALAVRIG